MQDGDQVATEDSGAGREDMIVYHLARQTEWDRALAESAYAGSAEDRRDGFLHFSTAEQIVESARKHRAGEAGLVLLRVRAGDLGQALRWEESRGGQLFPHLYGELDTALVRAVDPLSLDGAGAHVFPALDTHA